MAECIALVMAAGRGVRFGGDTPKQYQTLGGRPMLVRALEGFLRHPAVHGVRPVIQPKDHARFAAATRDMDLMAPVDGGATRQHSVRLGLESLVPTAPRTVLIHDGARPFTDPAVVSRVVAALDHAPAAVPALAVTDTLKRGLDGMVVTTVDRSGLWHAQTPQGFRFADILAAHRRFADTELTDDAAVAERAGLAVALVDGAPDNLKVTTEDDLIRAERILRTGEMRTGMGFDAHRFGPGDQVTLCGIVIPHDAGLIGHSDADVGLHALTDALLGSIAAGDIGLHFSPSEPRWRGASSDIFLRHAGTLITVRGGAVLNVDLTLICERPRIGPHREAMAERIAEILDIAVERVSVKGTTTERMGFTGREEGIAAQAVATVRLP